MFSIYMVINGKKIADEILNDLSAAVKKLTRKPQVAAVLVGDQGNGRKFLEVKKKAAEKVGIEFRIYEFPEDISSKELRKNLVQIVKGSTISGMIIELPLPEKFNTQYILNSIPEDKDPDVLSLKAQGSFFGSRSKVLPPAVEAVKEVLEENKIDLKGKRCVIFGYGLLVGRPVSHWLASEGATVEVINEFTKSPGEISKEADIIISGVGKPNLITADMVKEGAIVIDFGYEELGGKVVGDVDFEQVSKKASLITPVPGGVGPIVVAAVLKNLLTLFRGK